MVAYSAKISPGAQVVPDAVTAHGRGTHLSLGREDREVPTAAGTARWVTGGSQHRQYRSHNRFLGFAMSCVLRHLLPVGLLLATTTLVLGAPVTPPADKRSVQEIEAAQATLRRLQRLASDPKTDPDESGDCLRRSGVST